jgi:hypothetical protein
MTVMLSSSHLHLGASILREGSTTEEKGETVLEYGAVEGVTLEEDDVCSQHDRLSGTIQNTKRD